ncbi:MAG: glycosyltransferase, partial [Bacteroidetes bacterium]|nr:glycosyltransferase [Bacteroidota bacterium]
LFEYGIMAKAVVARDTGPVKEVITHSEHGLLFGESEEEMEQCLSYLLNDQGKASELGKNLKKRILDNFTWEKTAQKVLSDSHLVQSQ